MVFKKKEKKDEPVIDESDNFLVVKTKNVPKSEDFERRLVDQNLFPILMTQPYGGDWMIVFQRIKPVNLSSLSDPAPVENKKFSFNVFDKNYEIEAETFEKAQQILQSTLQNLMKEVKKNE